MAFLKLPTAFATASGSASLCAVSSARYGFDCRRAVTNQASEMMRIARLAAFGDDRATRAKSNANQVMMNRANRQQRRNRRAVFADASDPK